MNVKTQIIKSEPKEFVTWTDKLACGVKIIDDQHKGLVDLVNEMFDHVSGNYTQEKDYFHRVIQEVVKYVKIHFANEERIMAATKFAGYAEHKKQHELFIKTTLENIKDYEAGKRFTLSTFTRFLRDWILSHIALVDKKYFEYFKSIAVRKDDGKLTINIQEL